MIQFRLLGPFELLRDGDPVDLGPHRQRAVLAALTIHANRVVSLDRLIDELWGEEAPAQAIGTLQAYVSNLRRVLEPDRSPREAPKILITQSPGYVLRIPPDSLDVSRFQALAAEGRRLLESRDPGAARDRLDEALSLWRGAALADFAFEPFAHAEAARLEEMRLVAQEDRMQASLDLGEHASAVPQLEAAVSASPLRERLIGMLMLALYRSGRQADALAVYQSARRMLIEELGIDPSPALRRLEADILGQSPSLEWRPPPGLTVAVPAPPPPAVETPPPAVTPLPAPVAAAPASALPRPQNPMVGRERELAVLRGALDQTAAGRGGAVLVQGEPGIGKTRLVQELLARAAEQGIVCAWGGSLEGGGTPAYWPWVEVIRTLVSGAGPEHAPAFAGPGIAELAQVVPEIQQLTGQLEAQVPSDPETARFRLFEAVARVLSTFASQRPLAIVLDDLQWADGASFQLLSFLAPRLRDSRLLILGTYRPAEIGPSHPLREALAVLSRHQVADRVSLDGLRPAEVAELIRVTTGTTVPARTVTAVQNRTEGNPFFVAELARLLAAEHELGGAELERAVPAGVRDVVRRRLARLPEETVAVLSLAAVSGRDFELPILERAAHLDADRTLELVEAALMSGLVLEHTELVGRFRFSHDLVRETILEELTAFRRARMHARIAAALEATYGDDPARVLELANHLYEAAPAGVSERAIPVTLAAAEVAYARLAHEQAEEQLNRALQLLKRLRSGADRDRKELEVQLRMNSVLMMTKGYAAPEAGQALARARELCLALGERRELIPVLWGLFAFNFVSARYPVGHEYAEQLLELAQASGDPAELVAAYHAIGSSALHRGFFRPARENLEKALEITEGLDDPWLKAWFPQDPRVGCMCFLAFALWELGETADAIAMAREATRMAQELGHDPSTAHALDIVAWVAALDRDVELTWSAGEEAVQFSREKRFPLYVALNTILRGWARAMRGQVADGLREIEEGLEGMKSTGARMLQTYFLSALAEVRQMAGYPLEACLELLDEALQLSDQNSEGFWRPELHRLRGELLLQMSPDLAEQAGAELQKALRSAQEREAVALENRVRESLARRTGLAPERTG
ncbi:MAG TPA: BTAD domain-containing putative transcriptional regulator [Actinomycetota bacterium]|nr:BTAD domain-containing putative transcriptional regulator [Actinomycetota bacterium]